MYSLVGVFMLLLCTTYLPCCAQETFPDKVFAAAANKQYERLDESVHKGLVVNDLGAQINNLHATIVIVTVLKFKLKPLRKSTPTTGRAAQIADWTVQRLMLRANADHRLAKEVIPLLQIAGELSEAQHKEDKAIHSYEEEIRLSQLCHHPVFDCHVSLSNLYKRMGKDDMAKKEAEILKAASPEVINLPAPGEILDSGFRRNK